MILYGFLLCTIFSCSTVVNRKLPIISFESFISNKKIKISFSNLIPEESKNELYNALAKLGLEKNLTSEVLMPIKYKQTSEIKEFKDFFPEKNINYSNDWDYEIKLTWKHYEFNEPYCIIFLSAIPCAFRIDWMIGARLVDRNDKIIRDYFIDESAVHMYWLYFLNPQSWFDKKSAYQEVLNNQLKNLLLKMKDDNLL